MLNDLSSGSSPGEESSNMIFEKIAGHKKQIALLQKSIESGRLAHAYIFSGPAFIGKKTVALDFAKLLLEIKNDSNDFFHPDFLQIAGDEEIKIEQVRDLIYKLSLKPYQAKFRVALIDNAERMNDSAQNSLLKLLEEPKGYTVIILVTSNANQLLRTISSRAQKINFGLVHESEYKHMLPEEENNLITTLASGRPGMAVNISADKDFLEELKQTEKYYHTMRAQDLVDKLKLAYELAGLETPNLKHVLDFWQIKYEQELYQESNLKCAHNLNIISKARRYLDQNVNSKLLLTNLMLSLM